MVAKKNKCFNSLYLKTKILVLTCWKICPSPHQKTKWPVPNLKEILNLESIPPHLLYQEQQQHFKNGLISVGYISCVSLK